MNILYYIENIARAIEPAVTVLAIFIGGFWAYMLFVKNRQRYPRAIVAHNIIYKPTDEKRILMHVQLTISNVGNTLLSIVSVLTRIQQVLPAEDEIPKLIEMAIEKKEREVAWPEIDTRQSTWGKGEFEIEPGEMDYIHYDFVLNNKVETIRIYSYVENEVKRRQKKNIGWGVKSLVDLEKGR